MNGNSYRYGLIMLVIAALLLVSCQNAPQEAAPTVPQAEESAAVEEADPGLITSADELAGIWLGIVAGERGYLMYTTDGLFTVALSQEDVGSAPRVSGEYWFEDGKIHLRDLENAGHWAVCDPETVGVYEVKADEDGSVQFITVEDGCDEGGFTRNYIFTNAIQDRVADPVAIE